MVHWLLSFANIKVTKEHFSFVAQSICDYIPIVKPNLSENHRGEKRRGKKNNYLEVCFLLLQYV